MRSNIDMATRPRGPLEPFASVVSGLAGVSLILLVGALILSVTTEGASVWGIGDTDVCVDNDDLSGGGDDRFLASVVRKGVAATYHGVTLCARHPTAGQRTLHALTEFPAGVVTFGLIFLLWRFVAGARRHGPFARVNARRLRAVAWWILIGDLVARNGETLARAALVRSMRTPTDAPSWAHGLPSFSLTMFLAGLGTLAAARILAIATAMHEEPAATV